MNLNEKIIKIRVELQNSKVNKSGKNSFAGFSYYELSDFLPKLNELMLEYEINDIFTIENDYATLILIYKEEKNYYKIPFKIFETPLTKAGQPMMQDIQYLGALNTYYKRYLYLNAFGITDGEVIDSMGQTEVNYRNEFIKYLQDNDLDEKEIAVEYKLNTKSTNNDFKIALDKLKGGN